MFLDYEKWYVVINFTIFDKTFSIQSAVTGELMLQNPIIPLTGDKMITD